MKNIKCCVIGDEGIGKSCILMSYTIKSVPREYLPTVFDNFEINAMIDKVPIAFHLQDTGGSEANDRFRLLCYGNTDVILICFSVMNSKSFENVELKWLPEAKLHCPNAEIILIGTKIDLRDDKAALLADEKLITNSEGLEMSKRIGAIEYLECSTFQRVGLLEILQAIARPVVLLAVEIPTKKASFFDRFANLRWSRTE